jgi:hypothetical protein
VKYAHLYVWGTPWETRPAALAFGKAIHKAVEVFYRNLMENGEIKSIEDLQDVFLVAFMAENKRRVSPCLSRKERISIPSRP